MAREHGRERCGEQAVEEEAGVQSILGIVFVCANERNRIAKLARRWLFVHRPLQTDVPA